MLESAGVKVLCEMLTHPDGPKDITRLNLTSMFTYTDTEFASHPYHLIHYAGNMLDDLGIKFVSDLLTHQFKPKFITSLEISGRLLKCFNLPGPVICMCV